MKKLLSFALAVLMVFTLIPHEAVHAQAQDVYIIPNLADYVVYSSHVENDGYIGIPIDVVTYAPEVTSNETTSVVLYVTGTMTERIGQASDEEIIEDLLNRDFIVVVVDYLNDPRTISPQIENSLKGLRDTIYKSGRYLAGKPYRYNYGIVVAENSASAYVLPAGYTIEKDVLYFDLLRHGAKGTLEYVIDHWNTDSDFHNRFKQVVGREWDSQTDTATPENYKTVMKKPNGEPIDWELKLDIFYPKNPKTKTPVSVLASSSETRNRSVMSDRTHWLAQLFKGYTVACYDHEYNPLSRDDHYSYYSGKFSTASFNGVKTHTAAIRKIRDMADSLGYDEDHMAVWGHSKSSYSALLANPNPTALTELSDLTAYGYPAGENYGEQPSLTYSSGEKAGLPIESNVQACYTSMGNGAKEFAKLLTPQNAPTIIACGIYDEFGAWSYWPEEQKAYIESGIPHLAISMYDTGHNYPSGIDSVLKYDRHAACLDFMDYYLKETPSKPVWISPIDNSVIDSAGAEIEVQFTGPIDRKSANNGGIKIVNTVTGVEAEGEWIPSKGGTMYKFKPFESLVYGNYYNIIVDKTLKDERGNNVSCGMVSRVLYKGGSSVEAFDDSDSSQTGDEAYITVNESSDAYISFKNENRLSTAAAFLKINAESDGAAEIKIYAAEGLNNTTAQEENLVANLSINGKKSYSADVSRYLTKISGTDVTFIIKAVSGSVKFTSKEGAAEEGEKSGPVLVTSLGQEAETSPQISVSLLSDGSVSDNLMINSGAVLKEISGAKKSVITFDISSQDIASKEKIELDLNVNSGIGNINVYGINEQNLPTGYIGDTFYGNINDYDETLVTWQNAPANNRIGNGTDGISDGFTTLLGTIKAAGAGKYTIDVTDYVKQVASLSSTASDLSGTNPDKEVTADKVTFVLSESDYLTKTVFYEDFENGNFVSGKDGSSASVGNRPYSEDYNYLRGGNLSSSRVLLSSNNNTASGGSKCLLLRAGKNWDRIKFFNTVSDRMLTSVDAGRKFTVSGKIKTNYESGSVKIGLMNASNNDTDYPGKFAGTFCGSSAVISTTDDWEDFSWDFTLTSAHISNQAAMLTFEMTGQTSVKGDMEVYIDDLKVTEDKENGISIVSDDAFKKVYSETFEDGSFTEKDGTSLHSGDDPFSEQYAYTRSGNLSASRVSVSSNNNTTSGGSKCLYITPAKNWDRIKFLNTITDRRLTDEDIGRTFVVKGKIKGENDGGGIRAGLFSTGTSYSSSFCGDTKYINLTKEWEEFSYTIKLTANHVKYQAAVFSFMMEGKNNSTGNDMNFCLDDLEVYETGAPDVESVPRLTMSDGSNTAVLPSFKAAYIDSDNKAKNFGDSKELLICGGMPKNDTFFDKSSVYLKFNAKQYSDSGALTLKFTANEASDTSVSVYASNDAVWNGNIPNVKNETFIANVNLAKGGEQTVDIKQYVFDNQDKEITFILKSEDKMMTDVVAYYDFEDTELFSESLDWRAGGGWSGKPSVVAQDIGGNTSKVLSLGNFRLDYNRVRLFNTVKTIPFGSSDKGKIYRISLDVYPQSDTLTEAAPRIGMFSSFYGTAGAAPVGSYFHSKIPTNQWSNISFKYSVTDSVINAIICALGMDQAGAAKDKVVGQWYFDNIKVEDITNTTDKVSVSINKGSEKISGFEEIQIAQDTTEKTAEISDAVYKKTDGSISATLSTKVTAPFGCNVEKVTYYCNGTELVNPVLKNGMSYVTTINHLTENYTIYAQVLFSDGSVLETSKKQLSCDDFLSYTVIDTQHSEFADNSKFTLTKTVRNNTTLEKEVILIIASYDEAGNLLNASISNPATLAASSNTIITASIQALPKSTAYVKAMIWTNDENMTPIVCADILNRP